MKKSNEKRRAGRPRIENPKSTTLPLVRTTPKQLANYKVVASRLGLPLSTWIRDTLDNAAEE